MTLLFLTGTRGINSQAALDAPAVGAIIYEQRFQDEGWTVVYHSPTHKNVMKLEWHRCYRVSPKGTYLVRKESSADTYKLKFYNTFNSKLIWEIDWRDEWMYCEMYWINDIQLRILLYNGRDPLEYSLLNIADKHIQEPYIPQAPPLPNLMLDLWNYEDGFYQESPIENIYVYARCSNVIYHEYLDTDLFYSICVDDGGEQVVVYDFQNEEVISTLENDFIGHFLAGQPLYYLFWSPSGRYLAYAPMGCGQGSDTECPRIRIFDIVSRVYINTDVSHKVGFVYAGHDLIWSPDERYLAARACESPFECAQLQLSVIDVKNNHFVFAEKYDFENAGYHSWAWSPDSQHIAFVDTDHQLVQINIQTKDQLIIATDVERIIAWN